MACSDNAGLIPGVNEGEPIEEGELIPVSFNVGFVQEVTPFNEVASFRAGGSNNFTLTYLEHFIFKKNANGYYFYKKSLYTGSDGSINSELPEGEYTSVFVAYASGIFVAPENIGYLSDFFFQVMSDASEEANIVDHFYSKTTYTVEKNAENSNPAILERP
jgi:hypothetical protein